MDPRRLLCGLTLAFLLCLSATPAPAEEVIEAWRSPFGVPRAVSVNPTDGSCWAATGSSVMHLAADHTVLSQTNGFWSPESLSANPTDGSCRVADTRNGEVVRLDSSGTELWRVGGFDNPRAVSVNATDGSCWVADRNNNQVVHLDSDGAELWRGGGFNYPNSVSVNSSDNSCWVADMHNNQVVHLDSDGAELWRGGGFYSPQSVSVNSSDSSCWVADMYNNQVVHLDSDGAELWRGGGFYRPQSVSVNSSDSSCWVADDYNNRVVHLDASGAELWWGGGFDNPIRVSADSGDNSCWVVDGGNRELVHLSEHGAELWRRGTVFYNPDAVSVNPTDGSCWADDPDKKQIVHLSADGMEQWRGATSHRAYSLAVNSSDGSCWVSEYIPPMPPYSPGASFLARLAPSGAELWLLRLPGGGAPPHSVSVNPSDGSGWAAAQTVSHVDAAGTELWSGTESGVNSVSVNSTDNSCWACTSSEVFHLGEGGTELWRREELGARSVSVDPTDGSCSVAVYDYVVCLDADGTELWRRWGFQSPYSVSVNPTDGSCWVADSGHDEVVHLDPDGVELWRGGGFEFPMSVSVHPIDGSCWVADRDNDQIVRLLPSPYDYNAIVITGSGGVVLVDGVDHRVSWAGAFAPGATLALEAVPDAPCYEFTGWTGDLTGSENPTIITLDTDKSVTANFALGQNTLSLAKSGGGGIEVDGTPVALPWSDAYDCGTSLTLQAVPDGGWHFLSWSGDLAGFPNPADVTVDADKSITANFTTAPHTFSVTAACDPSTVASAGSTSCTASILDSYGHGVASCSWDDGGAGGSFDPSPDVQNPTYTAPANTTDGNLLITLTVNATCDGPEPLGDSDSAMLTVQSGTHTVEVTANPPVPTTVPSGGSASLWANFSDSLGHVAASWSWEDGGAGGAFSPSADIQNPTYTAPENESLQDLLVTLTVTATCDGPVPLSDSDSTSLTVQPAGHVLQVYAWALPSTVGSGGTTSLTANYSDSLGHGIASWSWDDGGAGGTFTPAATVQNPTYTAPENTGGTDLVIPLTVLATCDGPDPLSDSDSVQLTVEPGICAILEPWDAEAAAGDVARVPVVLELGALQADRMAFSLQVTANGSAPALGGDLGFEAAAGLPPPGLVSPSGDMISVAWMTPLDTPVTGTVLLGDLLVPIAAEALPGDTYSICMLSVGASLGTEETCVDPGPCATLTVCAEVLVGDAYPELDDLNQDGDTCDVGEFGDDDLTWGDVITVFDAWAMPGSFPCEAGTDRFCAMDSYPPDTEEEPGGDGELTWGDVITTFDRWANPSLPRPWRPLCECAVPAPAAEASSAKAALGAAEVAEEPGLWIGDGSGATGSTVRLPVMIDLGDQEADRMAFSVELIPAEGTETEADISSFAVAEGLEEPVVLIMPEGGLGVAWLVPMEQPLSEIVSLGELVIEVPAEAGVGDAWGVYVNAVGASLGDEELDPQVVAGEDALVTVTPGESHDVSIRRFQVPQRAKVGTTRRLTIEVENLTETPELVELRLLRNGDLRQSWLVDLAGQARSRLSVEYTFEHEDRPAVEFAVEAAILEDQEPDDNFAAQIVEVR